MFSKVLNNIANRLKLQNEKITKQFDSDKEVLIQKVEGLESEINDKAVELQTINQALKLAIDNGNNIDKLVDMRKRALDSQNKLNSEISYAKNEINDLSDKMNLKMSKNENHIKSIDKLVEKNSENVQKAKDTLKQTSEKISTTYESVNTKIMNFDEAIQMKYNEIEVHVKEKSTSLGAKAKQGFSKLFGAGRKAINDIKESAAWTYQGISETGAYAWDTVSEKALKAKDKAAEASFVVVVSSAYACKSATNLGERAVDSVKQTGERTLEYASERIEKFSNSYNKVAANAKTFVKDTVNDVKAFTFDKTQNLKDAAASSAMNAKNAVIDSALGKQFEIIPERDFFENGDSRYVLIEGREGGFFREGTFIKKEFENNDLTSRSFGDISYDENDAMVFEEISCETIHKIGNDGSQLKKLTEQNIETISVLDASGNPTSSIVIDYNNLTIKTLISVDKNGNNVYYTRQLNEAKFKDAAAKAISDIEEKAFSVRDNEVQRSIEINE